MNTKQKLILLLAHIDMAQGTPFSRFNNPDYEPDNHDVEEAIERIDSLIDFSASVSVAYGRLEKEADWLANKLVAASEMIANASGMDAGDLNASGWRKVAQEAVKKNG